MYLIRQWYISETAFQEYLQEIPLVLCKPPLPVFAVVDGDDVLRGVEEPLAVVRPGQRAGRRVGV